MALISQIKQLAEKLSLSPKSLMVGEENDILRTAIAESVALMASIPVKHHEGLREAVLQSMTTGNGLQDLVPYIANLDGVTPPYPSPIAMDLTRKVYQRRAIIQARRSGTKQFRWVHVPGNSSFQEHIAMSGKIYSFDDPPVINSKTGQRGFPSDLPGCRCMAQAIVEWK